MKPCISEELIGQLCELAKLQIEPGETEALQRDLAQLVEFVSRLEELPSSGAALGDSSAPRRVDQRVDPPSDALLALSSHTDGGFVRVPRVIDSND